MKQTDIAFTISGDTISVFMEGKPYIITRGNPQFDVVKQALVSNDLETVRNNLTVKKAINTMTFGLVEVFDDHVKFNGNEISNALTDRIMEMVALGLEAANGYVAFFDRLMKNPSKTSVDELYLFIEACSLPITPDGYFLAYKKVTEDYKDVRTGKFDNSVGAKPEMPRNEVDDDRDNTCSDGLHFCSYTYLNCYGGDRVMVVKVDPADVVSIPKDYNNAKGRAWTYEVVGEVLDWKVTEITPWYTDEYQSSEPDVYDEDGYDENGYDHNGFDEDGLDRNGYDDCGYDENGYDEDGYDHNGFDEDGYDEYGHPPPKMKVPASNKTNGKLTRGEVIEIKTHYRVQYEAGETTLTAIGKTYGVHRETIARILRGEIWKNV